MCVVCVSVCVWGGWLVNLSEASHLLVTDPSIQTGRRRTVTDPSGWLAYVFCVCVVCVCVCVGGGGCNVSEASHLLVTDPSI